MAGTIETIIQELGQAYGTLANLADVGAFSDLLRNLGIDDPPDLSGDGQFSGKVNDVASAASDIQDQVETLVFAIDQGDLSGALSASGELLVSAAALVGALDAVAGDLTRASAGTPNAAELAALASTFTADTIGSVLAGYLDFEHPLGAALFALFGVLTRQTVTLPVNGIDTDYVRRKLVYGRLPPAVTNPIGALETAYDWGQQDFDATTLLKNVSNLLEALGPLTGGLGNDDEDQTGVIDIPNMPPTLEIFNLTFGKSPDSPPGLQAILYVNVGTDQKIVLAQLTDTWQFSLNLGGNYQEALIAKLLPPSSLSVLPPTGSFQGHLGVEFGGTGVGTGGRVNLFSISSGCVLDAQAVTVGLEADLVWNGSSAATADIGFMMQVKGGRLLVKTDDDGGLMSALLPADGADVKFDATIRWTPSTGLRFDGAAGLGFSVNVNRSVGPINIGSANVDVLIDTSKSSVAASVDGSVALGPITVSVQKIGVAFAIDFTKRGSLGNADLGIDFQPPKGLGITVDAGPVSGGGVVIFDSANSRYFGALELSVYSVSVKAFGVIDTKLPTGPGYSFLIIISAEFTPIQLGFGFTLNGVGGLIGINRSVDSNGLLTMIKTGQLDNVLFPTDVVDNAPAILNDVETLFPPTNKHYVFGPLAKMGWGTPTLVDGELGLIIEYPGPVLTIIGTVHAALPKQDDAVVELNLDVGGVLDFPNKKFSLDASLHDSRVGDFPITGDMAMRMNWGQNPNFALSLGGFNPHYNPPPGFPQLKPVSVDLGSNGNPSIVLSGYMALTSNTAQLGAKVQASISKGGASLSGFLKFDALFVFSPFSFEADIEGGVSASIDGYGISLDFHGTLSGPSPWHLAGKVCISLWLFDACADFSTTLGGTSQPTLPGVDPWTGSLPANADGTQTVPGLQPALSLTGNWGGNPPAGSFQAVTLVAAPQGTQTPIDPLGSATFRQKAVPLDLQITAFAGTAPSPQRNLHVSQVVVGPQTVNNPTPVTDYFAPGQYQKMKDADKLSSQSFVQLTAGFTLSSDALTFGPQAQVGLIYTDVTFAAPVGSPPTTTPDAYGPSQTHVNTVAGQSAAARAGLRNSGLAAFVDPKVAPLVNLANELYAIANIANLLAAAGFQTNVPRPLATTALAAAAAASATARKTLQVAPTFFVQPSTFVL